MARSKGGKAATSGFVSFFQVSMVGTFAWEKRRIVPMRFSSPSLNTLSGDGGRDTVSSTSA